MKTQTLETAFSDFHKLTFTVLKMHFKKPKPKFVAYRDYKNFNNQKFNLDFLSENEKYVDCSFK